jgi:hypothetical protein
VLCATSVQQARIGMYETLISVPSLLIIMTRASRVESAAVSGEVDMRLTWRRWLDLSLHLLPGGRVQMLPVNTLSRCVCGDLAEA